MGDITDAELERLGKIMFGDQFVYCPEEGSAMKSEKEYGVVAEVVPPTQGVSVVQMGLEEAVADAAEAYLESLGLPVRTPSKTNLRDELYGLAMQFAADAMEIDYDRHHERVITVTFRASAPTRTLEDAAQEGTQWEQSAIDAAHESVPCLKDLPWHVCDLEVTFED